MERRAECPCGQLTAIATGEPARVSVCHCLACKRRSGSALSYNATYSDDQVAVSGAEARYRRTSEDGFGSEFRFCPNCGSTVAYAIDRRPGMVTIPAGAFADPDFPEPTISVYGERRHRWCVLETSAPMEEL